MKYREVVQRGLILEDKSRFTAKDCKDLWYRSRGGGQEGLSKEEIRTVVMCSALHHGREFAEGVFVYGREKKDRMRDSWASA